MNKIIFIKIYYNMDNDEIFIIIESSLNNLLYNNELDYFKFYNDLYDYSINYQKSKNKNIRENTINFYVSISDKIKFIIDNYINNIFEKIINSKNLFQTYSIELNLFNSGLETINKLYLFFNNELYKLNPNYSKIDFIEYGFNKWILCITHKMEPFIIKKIKKYLDYSKREIYNTEIDLDTIYYINELLDNVYYCVEHSIIDSTLFTINIKVNEFINQNIAIFKSYNTINTKFLNNINTFNNFYNKKLYNLNLDNQFEIFNSLFEDMIKKTFDDKIKLEFKLLLESINIDDFKLDYCINISTLLNINNCIKYSCDITSLKHILDKFTYNLYDCYKEFKNLLDSNYLIHRLYNKLYDNYEIKNKVDDIFTYIIPTYKEYFTNTKNIIENFDKYIREFIYKNKCGSLKLFYHSLKNYFKVYNDDEVIITYYKQLLVKRLYKYNFNKKYIALEIEIIINLDLPCLYKINTIKNDLFQSNICSTEYNNINNRNDNITIATSGIWGLSPKIYKLNNNYFNTQLNAFNIDFTTYYNCKYENKKLEWCYNMSTCILNYNINNLDINIEAPFKYGNILCNFNDTNMILVNDIIKEDKNIYTSLVNYKILKLENNSYILNNDIKHRNIIIRPSKILKQIKKKQNKEIVFTKSELAELYIVRIVKADTINEDILITNTCKKFDISKSETCKILDKLVSNDYLSNKNNNYLYVI